MKRAMKKQKKEKRLKKKLKKKLKEKLKKSSKKKVKGSNHSQDAILKDIPPEVKKKSKAMAPMTKEEWDKKQNVVRKVYDETTGRHR